MTSTARASPKAVSGNQKLHHAMGHDPHAHEIRPSQRLIKEKMKQLDVEEPGALDGVDGLERFTELIFGKFSEEPLDHLASRLSEIERIDRYHRRALSNRKFALREFGKFF